jgi:hypothetical protein
MAHTLLRTLVTYTCPTTSSHPHISTSHSDNVLHRTYLIPLSTQVLFLGTAIYNGSVATCDNGYETIRLAGDEAGKGIIKTPISMASPSLTRCVGGFEKCYNDGVSADGHV